MGVCIEPDLLQEQMSTIMNDLEFVRIYPDNFLAIILVSFEEHLANVEEVTKQLQSNGLKWKIVKCNFALPKEEYLG